MLTQRRSTTVRKKQITNAARKLIIRYGSEHVTIRRIAKHIGISEAAVYRHFKNKGDIFNLLAQYTAMQLGFDIQKDNSSNGSSLEAIDNIMKSHISLIEQRQGISFQIIAEIISLGDKKLNRQFSKIVNDYIRQIAALISQGVKSGEIKEDIDSISAATMVYGMIQGLVNIWALSNYSFDLVEQYTACWDIFQNAMVKMPAHYSAK